MEKRNAYWKGPLLGTGRAGDGAMFFFSPRRPVPQSPCRRQRSAVCGPSSAVHTTKVVCQAHIPAANIAEGEYIFTLSFCMVKTFSLARYEVSWAGRKNICAHASHTLGYKKK